MAEWDLERAPEVVVERFAVRDAAHMLDRELKMDVLVLAEHAGGFDGRRLEVQRAIDYDEEDHRLGLDSPCIVTESGATAYGAIASWRLEGHTLHVTLTPPGSDTLNVDDGYELELDRKRVDVEEVRSALRSIVGPSAAERDPRS